MTGMKTEKTEVKVWRYSFPNVNGEGWAIFFLDSVGCFAALSDWGDWSYRWNPRGYEEGDGRDFRHFILSCNDDYLLRKIAPKQEWDDDATLKNVKEAILGMRRDGGWTKEEARDEWSLLDHCEGMSNEFNFWDWAKDTKLSDTYELGCYKYSTQAQMFLARCMPRLREAIKNELGL